MWNKLSNIANEAIVAAKDIKQHIAEVTTDEFEPKSDPETEHDILDSLAKENSLLKAKIKEMIEENEQGKKKLVNENKRLAEMVKVLENALAEKEKESSWEAENYQRELQEVIKSKNKVQREVERLTEELITVKSSINNEDYLVGEVEKAKDKIKALELKVADAQEEKNEWRKRYENYSKAEQDKVSRTFFIEFLADYSKVVLDPIEKEKLMQSLIDILHLTRDEMKTLSLTKEDDKEFTLFDKFNKFLSDFSG